ncbi:MAG: hypothetical protein H6720_25750 [Sandaracinus sp.]|nr:hypothetical protein [Sandaracinus sp.]
MRKRMLSLWLVLAAACGGDTMAGRFTDGGVGGPTYDACGNGLDDDGDGRVDEDCFCAGGESQECFARGGLGACGPGTQTCEAASGVEWGRWGACVDASGPNDELCDGTVDDDCDGTVDEGCACVASESRRCGASETGACRGGEQRCEGGRWSGCDGAVLPRAEICGNRLDDDCDGVVDDPSFCACPRPEPERCGDEIDNDCDGVVDEPDACVACEPIVETCGNGEDDDCDGRVDEGETEICGDGVDQDCDGGDLVCPTLDGGTPTDGGRDAGILTDPGPTCEACRNPGYAWDVVLPGAAVIQGIAIDGAGDVLLVGTFRDTTLDLGGGPRTAVGQWGFLVKIGRDGTYRWDRVFDGLGSGFTRVRVAADAWGNVFVGGSFEGTLDLGGGARTSSGGNSDAWLASYDRDGGFRWDSVFGGEGYDAVGAIAVEPTGHLFVAGDVTRSTDLGGGPRTPSVAGINAAAFVASYDRDGLWLWDRVVETVFAGTSVAGLELGSDGLYAVGHTSSNRVDFGGGERTIPAGGALFLAHYALADGAYRWDRRYEGPARLRAVTRGRDGNLYLAGTFATNRPTDFGGGDRLSLDPDAFVASYDADGRYRWDRTFGNDLPESVDGLAVDPYTNLFVVGSFHEAVDFGGGTRTAPGLTPDAFLASYAADRTHRYDRTWGSPGNTADQGSAVAIDPRTGTLYAAGAFSESVDFGGGRRMGPAGFLVALGCACSEAP